MTKKKFKRVTVTAELLIDEDHVCPDHSVEEDLVNQYVKVKSSVYENLADGSITKVLEITEGEVEVEEVEIEPAGE